MLGGSLWAAKKPAPATPEQASDRLPSRHPRPIHCSRPRQVLLSLYAGAALKELAGVYNRPDYIDRAVSEYKLAIAADPDSLFLRIELAELYSLSGHTDEGIRKPRPC